MLLTRRLTALNLTEVSNLAFAAATLDLQELRKPLVEALSKDLCRGLRSQILSDLRDFNHIISIVSMSSTLFDIIFAQKIALRRSLGSFELCRCLWSLARLKAEGADELVKALEKQRGFAELSQ